MERQVMSNEVALAFAQALRWIIAGVAGAAFMRYDLLDRNASYLLGFMVPLILSLAFVEYMILILIKTA